MSGEGAAGAAPPTVSPRRRLVAIMEPMPPRHDTEHLTVDELTFTVRRSPRRRTIGITVERDGGLRVTLPSRCRRTVAEQAVRTKLPWVRRKLAEYEAMGPPPPPRQFADGERLPYRGRWHEIRVTAGGDGPVSVALRRGRFELSLPHAARDGTARAAFVDWYTARARVVLAQRVEVLSLRVRAKPMQIRVRDMGRRWGTCNGSTGVLSFHWETILLPPHVLDYIVVHELAHLLEPNHGPRFWTKVETVVPDWRDRRRWLRTDAPAFLL